MMSHLKFKNIDKIRQYIEVEDTAVALSYSEFPKPVPLPSRTG